MKKNINNLSRARHDAVILIRAGAWRRLRNWIVEWFHILFHILGVPVYIYITHISIYTLCRERETRGERNRTKELIPHFLFDGPHESWPKYPFLLAITMILTLDTQMI